MRNGRKYMFLFLDRHCSSDLTPDPRIYPSWPELLVVRVIIMLKLNVGPVEIVVLHSITKRSVQNMLVNTQVQVSIVNLASISWSFRDYTTPGHHFASSVIDCKIQVMMLKKVTWPFPIVISIIKALYAELGLIKVHCLLSVTHCLTLMLLDPF